MKTPVAVLDELAGYRRLIAGLRPRHRARPPICGYIQCMPICPNCGRTTSRDARFCPGCGAPQRRLGGAQVPSTGIRPPESSELCEIRWWRGYIKAEFLAIALGEGGRESEIGRSPQFLWRRVDPPQVGDERAKAAHDRLVARLAEGGWEPLGKAVPWYAQRFRRNTPGLRVLPADGAEAPDSRRGLGS